jgi:uncharacterized protein YigA (DUF484 family)
LDDGEGNELESHGEEELDTSMVMYLSKSPDCEFEKKKLVEETRIALKKMSVMSLCKPQLETIFNTIGNDAELVVEFQDHLSEFLADAMANKRIKNKSHGVMSGMQSLPMTDKTLQKHYKGVTLHLSSRI